MQKLIKSRKQCIDFLISKRIYNPNENHQTMQKLYDVWIACGSPTDSEKKLDNPRISPKTLENAFTHYSWIAWHSKPIEIDVPSNEPHRSMFSIKGKYKDFDVTWSCHAITGTTQAKLRLFKDGVRKKVIIAPFNKSIEVRKELDNFIVDLERVK